MIRGNRGSFALSERIWSDLKLDDLRERLNEDIMIQIQCNYRRSSTTSTSRLGEKHNLQMTRALRAIFPRE